MVCMLLEGKEMPYKYAALFGEPLDEQPLPATFHLFSDSVYRLPASGIHYPESLYTGVWMHAGTMLEHADKMVWRTWEEREQTRNQIMNPLEPVYDLRNSRTKNARWMNCRLVLSLRSQFFHNLRHFSSQANERSTTQRLGITAKRCSSLRLAT